jgi:hypothetical protein
VSGTSNHIIRDAIFRIVSPVEFREAIEIPFQLIRTGRYPEILSHDFAPSFGKKGRKLHGILVLGGILDKF